ncbi:unnamed protein product, partial [marine sediment metagenome]
YAWVPCLMAGKHTGAWSFLNAPNGPGHFQWNPRVTKAYAEGRSIGGEPPAPAGSPAHTAWVDGAANATLIASQYETATPGSS